ELHNRARPGTPATRSEIVATAANIGGLGFGPLLAGLLAQAGLSPPEITTCAPGHHQNEI
ncbi:MAG TPA: hypothetical protein VHF26_19390, partial [Trebonia sp.]|nr:hypothetical protein [Trebonia sp.]